jgi:hypothetical protein
MKLLACTTLVIMLAPAMAMAAESNKPQTLVLPGTMTPSGEKFASQCSDESFAKATSRKWLAGQCEGLLARWQEEARCEDPANSRQDCVVIDNSKPNALALRGIPKYPPSSPVSTPSRPASR